MTHDPAGELKLAPRQTARSLAGRVAAVVLGALFLAWPAFYNGFPLLYPDSMTYLDDGRIVARALFLHQFSNYYGLRSFFYSLGILPLHWNVTVWPVVALQCLLVAFVLWLVVRAVLPRHTVAHYLVLVLLLSLFTSAGWYASFILPDILGAAVYLSFALLVFARDTLSRAERLALYLIAWWGITSHATHFLLAAVLCLLLAVVLLVERQPLRRILKSVGEVALILALAAAAQLGLHGYLYGQPSLNGERPPFLMARVIADGPGRWYLEKNCGHLHWAICGHVQNLPDDPDNFLWAQDGIWQTGSDASNAQLVREEMPLFLATLRAYPREQLSRFAGNFLLQMSRFGLYDLDPSGWVLEDFDNVLPAAARAGYLHSRQQRNVIPLEFFTTVQFWAVLASLGLLAVFLPLLGRRCPRRLAELGVVVVFMVLANGLLTGALSMPEDRYECRVIWLLPLLAALSVQVWISQRRGPQLRAGRK
jgi:hypothetical protein